MAKKANAEKPKKSFGGILFRLSCAVVVTYLVVSFVAGQLNLAEKRRELESLQAQVSMRVEDNLEMQRMLNADDEDAYIERTAREKLGYARAGERVFVDLTGD